MLGFELSVHEIMPFDVFISVCSQKNKKKQKKGKRQKN